MVDSASIEGNRRRRFERAAIPTFGVTGDSSAQQSIGQLDHEPWRIATHWPSATIAGGGAQQPRKVREEERRGRASDHSQENGDATGTSERAAAAHLRVGRERGHTERRQEHEGSDHRPRRDLRAHDVLWQGDAEPHDS